MGAQTSVEKVDPLKPRLNLTAHTIYPRPYNPYPVDYNPRVHGPYDPARYYGAEPLGKSPWDVKLGELPSHIMKANKSPRHVAQVVSRWLHRYATRHLRVQKTTMVPFIQINVFLAICLYISKYGIPSGHGGIKFERRYKYHW